MSGTGALSAGAGGAATAGPAHRQTASQASERAKPARRNARRKQLALRFDGYRRTFGIEAAPQPEPHCVRPSPPIQLSKGDAATNDNEKHSQDQQKMRRMPKTREGESLRSDG